jgi:hypothetical protein
MARIFGLTPVFDSTALAHLLAGLSQHIRSDTFAQLARLSQYPSAFTRRNVSMTLLHRLS